MQTPNPPIPTGSSVAGTTEAPAGEGMRILMLDKVLIGPRDRHVRGVELFNVNLIRDLVVLGFRVTVPVHADWVPVLEAPARQGPLEVVVLPPGASALVPYRLAWRLGRRRFPLLLLGNVANRLIPSMVLLRLSGAARRCVLIAHREPSRRCLQAQKLWPSTIVTVNGQIADHFRRAGFRDVTVHYGVTDAGCYHPAVDRPPDGCVHFCVAGHLDNAWKGSDTAVAAFRLLPDALRRSCRLHLASFRDKPAFDDDGIIAYDWMASAAMPDFFRRMDVMIVPSRDETVMRETFSQVMVQGMLSGLPVLANRLPILEEKLDAGGGLVFDGPRELCDAMTRLAGDPALRRRMGHAARETALARYVWDSQVFAQRFLQPATG